MLKHTKLSVNVTDLGARPVNVTDLGARPYDKQKVAAAHSSFLASQSEVGFFQIDDLHLVASPGIYHPTAESSTLFMLRHLPACENCDILDIGTGTGAVGLHYAKRHNNVTLSDIDPEAIRCAAFNAIINNVSVEIVPSDVFSGVDPQRRFDVILFNLPFYQKEIEHPFEHIGCDPGGEVLAKFLTDLPFRLRSDGIAYVTYANLGDVNRLASLAEEAGFHISLEASERDDVTGVERYLLALSRRGLT